MSGRVGPARTERTRGTVPQPEVYIGGAGKLFDADGRLANESTREFLTTFLQAFNVWIERNAQSR